VHARGLGAPPIPVEQLQLQSLIDAIKFMIDPKVNILISVLVSIHRMGNQRDYIKEVYENNADITCNL